MDLLMRWGKVWGVDGFEGFEKLTCLFLLLHIHHLLLRMIHRKTFELSFEEFLKRGKELLLLLTFNESWETWCGIERF